MNKIDFNVSAPVVAEYDVVVCGGGPAGFIAAIAAAKRGARVALIEQYGFLGGTATAGFVAPISRFNFGGERVIGGIPWDFVERLKALGAAIEENPPGNISYVPEKYKLVAQRMVLESGVDLYLHTYLIGCTCENGHISHVILHTKKGAQAIAARYFVDCTGDADLAFFAGVPMQGKNPSGKLQPASLCFLIGGVDTTKLPLCHHDLDTENLHDLALKVELNKLADAGVDVPLFGGPWYCSIVEDGYMLVNMSRIEADMTDNIEATHAECVLREDVNKLVDILKKYVPGYENVFLLATATQVGVRETRRILGAHTLTGEEYLEGVKFDDSISRGCHPIDIHHGKDTGQRCSFLKSAPYIPYRTLYSPDFDNILVAGRCFSSDEIASASVRVQASVMGLGQAAGVGAAMCCENSCAVKELDTDALRAELIKLGAVID